MMESAWKQRNMMMIKAIAKHLVFYYFVKQYLDTQEIPTRKEITTWLNNNIDKLNEDESTTPGRRASTVMGWVAWIIQITNYDDC